MMELDIDEAWSAHPGDTVFLRLKRQVAPRFFDEMRATLDTIEEKTGVHIVILTEDVEVVSPTTGAGL